MELKVFAVRDMKALAFMKPFVSVNIATAIRDFGDACNEQNSPFYKHPEDYVLYEIGLYNDQNGELSSLEAVKMLGAARDFVKDIPLVGSAPKAFVTREEDPVLNGGTR